jgi:hypothetical protein
MGGFSPPARVIRVQDDAVAIEGRWHPIEPLAGLGSQPNGVRASCVRKDRVCREEITTATAGGEPRVEVFDYRVREWTKIRLVAARRTGPGVETQLRVSLVGNAAEKAIVRVKAGDEPSPRWRLE